MHRDDELYQLAYRPYLVDGAAEILTVPQFWELADGYDENMLYGCERAITFMMYQNTKFGVYHLLFSPRNGSGWRLVVMSISAEKGHSRFTIAGNDKQEPRAFLNCMLPSIKAGFKLQEIPEQVLKASGIEAERC